MVRSMQKRGVPIDGVGLQMHIHCGYTDVPSVKRNMQRYSDIGLEVHITELDIRCGDNGEQEQARIYAELLQACVDVPSCKSFQTWGFTDDLTWLTEFDATPFAEGKGVN